MRKVGTFMLVAAIGAVAVVGLSGGTSQVPQTPKGPEGLPTPFLGVAVLGTGGVAAALDAYGSVVELRSPGPAGAALISTPYKRQAAGSVDERTGIVVRAGAGGGELRPLWRAERVEQSYIGANAIQTGAEVAGSAVTVNDAIAPGEPLLAREISIRPVQQRGKADMPLSLEASFNFDFGAQATGNGTDHADFSISQDGVLGFAVSSLGRGVRCSQASSPAAEAELEIEDGIARWRWRSPQAFTVSILCDLDPTAHTPSGGDAGATTNAVLEQVRQEARQAVASAQPLGSAAPTWATALYERSLLVLLALSDRSTGAMPAGLRDHWHYIWPRDAAVAALALNRAGLHERAKKVAEFVTGLDAAAAARFTSEGQPVDDGRHVQGDGAGWARLAQRIAGHETEKGAHPWRDQGDYGERDDDRGDYLANAIVAGASADEIETEFASGGVLLREAGASGRAEPALDTAAAWAVRPFPRPALYPYVRETLLQLAATAGPYGLFPASDWRGRDPWTAATASTAWSLAALGERDEAIKLMRAVNRAATPLGMLPERADIENGLPRSTTPLAWSHAFAVLALRELWPG